MTRLESVLTEDDLPLSELWAACRDGELVPLSSSAFAFADVPQTPAVRALAVHPVMARRTIIERHSAAWVHGALSTPPRVHTIAVRYANRSSASRHLAVVREVALRPGDTMMIDGIEITTPLRTAVDLARDRAFEASRDSPVIAKLLASSGLPECRSYLDTVRNLPHKARALHRITDALLIEAMAR
ncbi:type IV toxin-antitoxin system AbiEi family antitoxin [Agreia bicolorata]|uniref:type IV toxin-antitoxin system AbiEi family antitoxin n=1 Tax=Agreia bicolorata TaxID=110935 RepID=UPI0006983866|nr:type IV toxin-antitoxin system AbiEi family antitoxin [Agreia bicolorata]